ncbi:MULTISPECIES: cupin domain-containing protein [unclassified Thioalkalivibrio]|uniref:cupin domain-containing protein n=1 Tax=unclassified Thioalkalivibrio TaxID=2621013 RepID=UPI00036648CD|nr:MULTISPECIES: cupin domain-containing protein [unclassified Thioalkalivibrio]
MAAPDPNQPLVLLGGLTPAEFLRDYWQQRPLLVRNAVPGFENPIEPDDLAGLATDPDAASRIVRGHVDRQDWDVEYGPFDAEHLGQLPAQDWTLLVTDVERFWPGGSDFLARFDFIPRWRRDDLMISYAPPGGSVGPHVDQYDVFLFQAAGRRRWQIQDPPGSLDCHDDLPLAILREFHPSETWELGPGDLLYLPPGLPHYGLSLDAQCMTWSVGFRAPTILDVLTGFLEERANVIGDQARFEDPGRHPAACPAELPAADRRELREALRALLAAEDHDLDAYLGRFLTRPAGNIELAPEDPGIAARAGAAERFVLHPGIRRAWFQGPDGPVLCVGGNDYPAQRVTPEILETFCRAETLSVAEWEEAIPAIRQILADGLEAGWIAPETPAE